MKQVYLGTLTKPHGLKGAAFFNMENVEDTQVAAGKEVTLTSKDQSQVFVVESLNIKGKRPILKLEGINSREELEAHLPSDVFMDRAQFSEPQEGQFYLSDIIGFSAVDGNEEFGVVSEFYSNGAQDIAVVKGKEEWDIPVEFVEEVLWDEKKVKIQKPEYL